MSYGDTNAEVLRASPAFDALQTALGGSLDDGGGGGSTWAAAPASYLDSSAASTGGSFSVGATSTGGSSLASSFAQTYTAFQAFKAGRVFASAPGATSGPIATALGLNQLATMLASANNQTIEDSDGFSQIVSLEQQLQAAQQQFNAQGGQQVPVFSPASSWPLLAKWAVVGAVGYGAALAWPILFSGSEAGAKAIRKSNPSRGRRSARRRRGNARRR
jgi:hypothetical protein